TAQDPFNWGSEIIQRSFLEIIDEIRDEFPNLLRLTSSNQKPRSVITRELSSTHGAIIMNGLTKLSRSSKSVAKFLQPRFARKITELSMISHHFLETLNSPKQPLYGMKDRTMFFYDVISYPARTALTSVMCVSYAALIYLVSITKILCIPEEPLSSPPWAPDHMHTHTSSEVTLATSKPWPARKEVHQLQS
uniref:Uncharacterized protein n=1 Tax=Varanus komodoensis TaxID=61221 RepID=A0A8D2J847_VARKO